MDEDKNHLIERFPRELQKSFLQRCERFELSPKHELVSYGAVLTHAYFPSSGAIALLINFPSRPTIHVGNVGRECMLGSELMLGDLQSPWRAVVQVLGSCWRIEAQALREAMAEMPPLLASLRSNFIVQVHQRQAMGRPNSGYLQREIAKASIHPLKHHGSQLLQGEHSGARSPPSFS